MIFAIISVALLLISIFCFLKKFAKNTSNIIDSTSLIIFISILLSGFFVMLFADKDSSNELGTNIIESLYMSLKLFYADGTARFTNQSETLGFVLNTIYYVLAFYAPLTLICTVLSHFSPFFKMIRIKHLSCKKHNNIIIFNELNEKNFAIAKNYKYNKVTDYEKVNHNTDFKNCFYNTEKYYQLNSTNKLTIIFCDVYKQNTESFSDLSQKAIDENFFLFKDDIISLHSHIRKSLSKNSTHKLIRYFLSGIDETENIHHSVEIANTEKSFGKDCIKNLALFTFAEGDANGHILESLNTCDDFFVKRIRPSKLLSIDIVTENKLIDKSIDENIEKDIKILIVGTGNYGFEIGKFLSWYYQRLKGNIIIYFFDKDPNIKSTFSGIYDDFINYKKSPDANPELNPCFELKFYEGINVFSDEFSKLLKDKIYCDNHDGIDAVFCTLGNDNLNLDAAIHIRTLIDRINHKKLSQINLNRLDSSSALDKTNLNQYLMPEYRFENDTLYNNIKIFAVVHDDRVTSDVNSIEKFSQHGYDIILVGSNSSLYCTKNIFDLDKEIAALSNNDHAKSGISEYYKEEYRLLSSLSSTFHNELIEELYIREDTDKYRQLRQKISCKRRNAYLISNGYTHFETDEKYREILFENKDNYDILPMRKWKRGKWHNSIVPFDSLPSAEQENFFKDMIQ